MKILDVISKQKVWPDLPRLMDMGLGKLTDVILHMAEVSENSVNTAIHSYVTGKNQVNDILLWSNEIREKLL